MPLPSKRSADEERHSGQFVGWYKSCHLRVSFPTGVYDVIQAAYCSSQILRPDVSLFSYFSVFSFML